MPGFRNALLGGTLTFVFLLLAQAASGQEDFDIDAEAEKILSEILGEPEPLLESITIPKPKWKADLDLRGGAGYKKNVLYSAYNETDSYYSLAEVEAFLFRENEIKTQLYGYAFADQRHYFELDRGDDEQSIVLEADMFHRFTPHSGVELRGNYFYIDQFFDASVSEIESDEIRLKQHDLSAHANYQHWFGKNTRFWLGGGGGEVLLENSDDDYTQWEGMSRIEYNAGKAGRYGLRYLYEIEQYHDRLKRTAAGEAIEGETVDVSTNSVRAYGYYDIDRNRFFTLYFHLTGYFREDNGGGYYDYDRISGTLGLRAQKGPWRGNLACSYGQSDYPVRPSDYLDPESPTLYRDLLSVWVRPEYTFRNHWFIFSDISWEDNDALDEYSVFSGAIGLGFRM
jgi:hypothetical protein